MSFGFTSDDIAVLEKLGAVCDRLALKEVGGVALGLS
jgi:hypothetical protein